MERKRILAEALLPTDHIQTVSYVDTEGQAFFNKINIKKDYTTQQKERMISLIKVVEKNFF